MRLVVDGQTFEVTQRVGHPKQYDFTWLSGPNAGYGFSMALGHATVEGAERPAVDLRAHFERVITDFLTEIDPDTGYLRD